jgi:hypothetical protein
MDKCAQDGADARHGHAGSLTTCRKVLAIINREHRESGREELTLEEYLPEWREAYLCVLFRIRAGFPEA